MKAEAQGKKLSIKTSNWDGAGGGYGVISASDLAVVIAAINPDPLTHAHFMAHHGHWPVGVFQSMLFADMRERVAKQKTIKESYLIKNHKTLFEAARLFSVGIADYLARHKLSQQHLSSRFGIEKSKFSRYYAEFINDCIADYEQQLNNLTNEIHKRTKDD